jgi:hypothetical protein
MRLHSEVEPLSFNALAMSEPVVSLMERPSFAWSGIAIANVFDCLVYLPETVKVSIPLRAHLT